MKKILISQPKPSSEKSPYYDIEKDYGVECVFRPFFKVEGLTAKEFRQQKINLLDYTAVVFTSRHAIDNYFKLAKEMRITIPEDMKYFCVLETIALYIQKYVQYRKRKVFFTNTGKAQDRKVSRADERRTQRRRREDAQREEAAPPGVCDVSHREQRLQRGGEEEV